MHNEPTDNDLVKTLGDELTACYGPVLSSRTLATVLGYTSGDAFRQALSRKTVPVPVFRMPNRRGCFALTRDVTQWLVAQRQSAMIPQDALNIQCALNQKLVQGICTPNSVPSESNMKIKKDTM